MNPTTFVRGTAAFALGGTATVLSGTAKALQFVAGKLRGSVEEAAPEPVRDVVDSAADVAESAADATSKVADDTSGSADEERAAAQPDAGSDAGEGSGAGVAEATARLEDLAGRTSGAPPPIDEIMTPADVPSPGTQPSPGTAGADAVGDAAPSRTYESQTAALAAKPAGEVVRAVRGMSTDGLEALLDYEMSHRKRKTVLGAIERELTPPTEELVYSTPDR